jgi:molecular chaperone GrpE
MADQNDEPTESPDGAEVEIVGEADVIDLVDPNPELTTAKAELSELQARLRAVSAAYRQIQEEVEATKERLNRQAAFQRELQRGETVAKMFDPLDNLNRSIETVEDGDTKDGLKMVVNQFMTALSELGLEVLSPEGHAFDPNVHEAISVVPVPDEAQDDMVIDVFSAGYRVGSRLLKPARVVIGKFQGEDS